jgi:hypothetical protein
MTKRSDELGPELEVPVSSHALERERFEQAVAEHFGFGDADRMRAAFKRYSRAVAALIQRGECDAP